MEAVEILEKHNLKRTSCREGIIELVMNASHALSENEIRKQIAGNYDRTTFYRSFKTLVENNIIHKVVVDNNLVKYGVSKLGKRKKTHPHFYCEKCETVLCLNPIELPNLVLPEGYKLNEIDLIIKGECNKCANNKKQII